MRMGVSAGDGFVSTGFDPQSVVHYDTRRHLGPTDPTLVNYGSSGDMFDLEVIEYAPGNWWAVKRFNWYGQGTTGNGIYPSTWADFGGHPSEAPFFFASYMPSTFSGIDDTSNESEWYVNPEVGGDIAFGAGNYVDYFDNPNDVSGFTTLYWGGASGSLAWTQQGGEFYPEDFQDGGQPSSYADCIIAHYLDQSTGVQGFWKYDGINMYKFVNVVNNGDFIEDGAPWDWIYQEDNGSASYPDVPGNVSRFFWSFSYHTDHYPPIGGYGESWGQCTGNVLTRPTPAQQLDLDQYVRDWWLYYRADVTTINLLNPDL